MKPTRIEPLTLGKRSTRWELSQRVWLHRHQIDNFTRSVDRPHLDALTIYGKGVRQNKAREV